MTLKTSQRGTIPPFIVMDVMRAAHERAAAGGDVLHLEVGQPSTSAPPRVIQAAKDALDGDLLGYTLAFGIPQLRERIARYYGERYGVSVDAERVVVTIGSSGGFLLSFLSAFDVGDRVALASPGYPAYRNILTALGIEVVDLLTGPEDNFQPTPELLAEVEGPLDGLIVASPSNPAGTMIEPDDFAALLAYCKDKGIRVISDEIYHGITYGTVAEATAAMDEDAIVINSFSKYFSMTGWRLGWMILPKDLLRPVECLAQNLFISAPTVSQLAALAAFDSIAELDANVARYADNRALLLEELPKAGFDKLSHADGAFYVYADVSDRTDDSQAFCKQALHDIGVAFTPGVDFDPTRGRHFVRFSFAGSTEDMREACRRLKGWRG